MHNIKTAPPSQNRFILTGDDLKKYDYISTFEDVLLFNRMADLLTQSTFKHHIRQYLMEYYLLGYSEHTITTKEADLLDLLDEFFELYLFHNNDEYKLFIVAELLYNSHYNDLTD